MPAKLGGGDSTTLDNFLASFQSSKKVSSSHFDMFLQHRVLTCCRSDVRFHSECPPGVNSTVSPVRFSTKKSSQKSQRTAFGFPPKNTIRLCPQFVSFLLKRELHTRESLARKEALGIARRRLGQRAFYMNCRGESECSPLCPLIRHK